MARPLRMEYPVFRAPAQERPGEADLGGALVPGDYFGRAAGGGAPAPGELEERRSHGFVAKLYFTPFYSAPPSGLTVFGF